MKTKIVSIYKKEEEIKKIVDKIKLNCLPEHLWLFHSY